jgi:pimeloyl-ACP methyl ester carboxylesterase
MMNVIFGGLVKSLLSCRPILFAAILFFGPAVQAQEHESRTAPAIVVGFVGGFIRHDDLVHSEVQLAARLRKDYPSGVAVETFESYRGERARKRIHALLDANHDGHLTADEKQNARIILYGHSWGASAAIAVARELGNDGIPVLLTIQIDSVAKFYQNDTLIPANVAQAANFYQPDGIVHGPPAIHAADPTRTKILGNFMFEYKNNPYTCNEYPWYDRIFVKPHTQIECDPGVWAQAEALIRSALPTAAPSERTR